ncbi:MAG: class I SAM-dependent methyltransferase [Spirochaetales bacterium]|nr:class I SAM-dependent methyltransferase [Spirochaetales bacterium]
MKNRSKRKWNNYYKTHSPDTINFDSWLEQYEAYFRPGTEVLEVGCGYGFHTEYLVSKGCHVCATDFSKTVLNRLKKRVPGAAAGYLDLSKRIRFPGDSFDAVIADLCLHYFDDRTTRHILTAFRKILRARGRLFCRLNSIYDLNHGAGQGEEIESNYYRHNGIHKRFFSKASINDYFKEWEIESIANYDLHRHEKTKNIYEVICRNIKENPCE